VGRLQTGRLENFIRRWGSIKGGGSLLSETLGEVFPVLDLENLSPENYLPAGWTPFFGFTTVVGVAAQLQGASLINPAASGNIIVVDLIVARVAAAANFTLGNSLPLFTPILNATSRDTRELSPLGGARIGANANVGAAETGLLYRQAGGLDREIILPHGTGILAPGTQIAVVGSTVNNTLNVGFSGRIRVAEPSELSF